MGENEKIKKLIHDLELKAGRMLTSKEVEVIANWHAEGNEHDLILKACDVTLEKTGKFSWRHMDRWLLNPERYERTENLGGEQSDKIKKTVHELEKMVGRRLTPKEQNDVALWLDEGADPELILKACEVTYDRIGKISWAYLSVVIRNWITQGCFTVASAAQYMESTRTNRQNKNNTQKFYILKVLDQQENWYTNAFIENDFDAIRVAMFYRDQLGYNVQIWYKGKDVSFLMNGKNAVSKATEK